MALLSSEDRRFAGCVSELAYCNPFLPRRIDLEREALGDAFTETPKVWSLRADRQGERANLARLVERVEPLAGSLRQRLVDGERAGRDELILYEDLILYMLYQHDRRELEQLMSDALAGRTGVSPGRAWKVFRADFDRFLVLPGVKLPNLHDAAHVFAVFFQIRRAFLHIFGAIVGGSLPAAQLRAAVWESIFSHDFRRYYRVLHRHMADFTTLVTGPSGTGKELVARAIAQSRYIPFDADSQKFTQDFTSAFHALNLSALSPTLIESELFGHKRGAFTGAIADRAGWLEVCGPLDTVFLDEIGELDPGIQVKLLRVLHTRTFQRIGDTKDHHFQGKIIAATNTDLARKMREGRFRPDFYYRLCSDIITPPSLQEQLADDPEDLRHMLLFITRRIVDEENEAAELAREAQAWINEHLGGDYPWPGNFRELEQCVRNLIIRRTYRPPQQPAEPGDPTQRLIGDIQAASLTADELVRRYCTLVYARLGSYQATARKLGLDRRTVQSKVDADQLEAIRARQGGTEARAGE